MINLTKAPTTLNNTANARVGSADSNVLASLGNQTPLNPELKAMLESGDKIPEEFAELLAKQKGENPDVSANKEGLKEGENPEELTEEAKLLKVGVETNQKGEAGKAVSANAKQEVIGDAKVLSKDESALKQLLAKAGNENGQVADASKTTEVKTTEGKSSLLVKPEVDEATQATRLADVEKSKSAQKSMLKKPVYAAEEKAPVSIEKASRAIVPERKSMFVVNRDKVATEASNTTEQSAKNISKNVSKNNGLMDLNSFLGKQGATTKKVMGKSAYKANASQSLFNKKVVNSVPSLGQGDQGMKVSDLMLVTNDQQAQNNMGMDSQNKNPLMQANTATGETKVFDLSQLQGNENTNEVITKIQDYIIQAKFSKDPQIQMTMKHDDLGAIDLFVQKGANNQVSIVINSATAEGSKFFAQNQAELLGTLAQAGVNVSELKLDSSSTMGGSGKDDSESNQSSQKQDGQQKFGSKENEKKEDQNKREELWKLFNDRKAA